MRIEPYRRRLSAAVSAVVAAFLATGVGIATDERPHAGMLRYPDISDTDIVFVYANDLWIVPRDGGLARPLASPPGEEGFARFSPDGQTIAFVGNYDGNRDLYTIPTGGGVPLRVTYHPAGEVLCDWTPDGKRLVYYAGGTYDYPRAVELFTIDALGGMHRKMPVPYGAAAAISPDGQWLAYTPHTRDQRTWKRYRGGMATDIWLFNLETYESRRLTSWEGTDTLPMWHGRTIYYLCDDGPSHRLNIWSIDLDTNQRAQVTQFADYDVKWPAIGGGRIVFQLGGDLMTLDLASGQTRRVEVVIPGDRPQIRPRTVNAYEQLQAARVSSTGRRAVVEARGDIWTLPARHGSPRNLTRTSPVAERDPSWSPDGRWIAYFSDETGEYELYVMQSDGNGERRRVTTGAGAYLYSPIWSPDSKWIVFSDKTGGMHLCEVESGATHRFDTSEWGVTRRFSWSSDSNWIAYTKAGDNRLDAIWLYNVTDKQAHQVTSGMFAATWPTFDRAGDYLYLASNCDFGRPQYGEHDNSFVYIDTDRLLVVPLRAEVGSPLAPKSDEEKWGDDKDEDGEDDQDGEKDEEENGDDSGKSDDADDSGDGDNRKDQAGDPPSDEQDADDADEADDDDEADGDDEKSDKKDKGDKKPEPVEIELEGFERRAILLPVKAGSFYNLAVNDQGHLLYIRGGAGVDEPAIKVLDLTDDKKDEPEEKTVLANAGYFDMTADGKKILVRRGNDLAVVDAKADQKFEPKLSQDLNVAISPREEWRQLLREAWRVQRDFFYDPHMHGVDWDAIYEQYAPMLEYCVSREDVSYIIREMIAELNVGHAYYWGGDGEDQPRMSVGMLGCDFELDEQGAGYRIAHVCQGGPWDADARGPLSQPGIDVKVGDYLLAVNGVPVDTTRSPYAALVGKAGATVILTVNAAPLRDGNEREVTVKLLSSESDLRYRCWVEKNRRYVDEKSGGKVGYIYVPNTGRDGQNELFRQFFGQSDKQALIIDERWNGGGQIPDRFIELLNRPVRNYWARRDGQDWTWPPGAHNGPKCMLINGLAGSGGDCFPFYFRQSGLGPLIGTRTWGGLVGISGNPRLIDGGYTSAPTFAFYETDGTWGIEGHGVDPDYEVIDDPAKMVSGADPQIDKAIELMLAAIEKDGYQPPSRPDYPDRHGMGIVDKDK